MNAPAAAIAASAAVNRLVWTHVRQALQQVVAAGATSAYLAAVCVRRPFQTLCTGRDYPLVCAGADGERSLPDINGHEVAGRIQADPTATERRGTVVPKASLTVEPRT
jgi:hypothetical protein